MIPHIKNILYTTDLSTNARYAFGYAADLANRYEATVTILHILEAISHNANLRLKEMLGETRWKELQDRNIEDVHQTIQQRLARFCEDMQQKLVNCPFVVKEVLVQQGEPVDRIMKLIETGRFELVVMGTHGQGLLADAMLGSTARRVVRRSLVPVLTVRLPSED